MSGTELHPLRIYLDSDGLLDLTTPKSPTDDSNEEKIISALECGRLLFVTSEITILETFVHARRNEDERRQASIKRFLTPSDFIETRAVSLQVIESALTLRVRFGLKSPDAIHIATGLASNCQAFLTKDEKWGKLSLSILTIDGLADLLED